MKRYPPLTPEQITARLRVDAEAGKVYWIDATKHHRRLNGCEAGSPRPNHSGKAYWHVKIDGIPYRRSHLVTCFVEGAWPAEQIDHINGHSLDDRYANLRHATQTQNAWNHKGRAKQSDLPMGVRKLGERFQARIAVNKRMHYLGVFPSVEEARAAYLSARASHFGEFA